MQIAEARPPYVEFETRAIEKRKLAPPADTGEIYWENIDFVIITPQGSKDRTEKQVSDWLASKRDLVKASMYPPEWLQKHEMAYKYWKENNELPLEGTPIKGWPLATAAEQVKLVSLNIKTVEDLANANQETISRIGMGGMTLKTRGENFLLAKKDAGPLVSRVEALSATVESLTGQLKQLLERNQAQETQLRQFMGKPVADPDPPPLGDLESRLAIAQDKQPPDATEMILSAQGA